jgi:hypothetical protein
MFVLCVLSKRQRRGKMQDNRDKEARTKYRVEENTKKKKKHHRGWMFFFFECCVSSGRCLCDGPIPCAEKSYRLWSVVMCD